MDSSELTEFLSGLEARRMWKKQHELADVVIVSSKNKTPLLAVYYSPDGSKEIEQERDFYLRMVKLWAESKP